MLILFLSFSSCSTVKDTDVKFDPTTLAKKEFGDRFRIQVNDEETHSIISQKIRNLGDLFSDVDFFVLDHKTEDIIWRDTLTLGNAYWTDQYLLKADQRSKDSEGLTTYFFDVKKKKILDR